MHEYIYIYINVGKREHTLEATAARPMAADLRYCVHARYIYMRVYYDIIYIYICILCEVGIGG